ncbi:MAG: GNAT family N-acetyltransferase [Candidatus Zixiibacteriota bacterium]
MLIFSTDKSRLERHFRKDPALFAYHLGDLDDFFFPHCQWMVSYGERARIEEALLVYTGLEVPTVLIFGLTDRLEPLVKEAVELLPDRFFCHYQKSIRPLLFSRYREQPLGTHLKMRLEVFVPQHENDKRTASVQRLDRSHVAELRSLYSDAYPDSYFSERMLDTGKYFGFVHDGAIVSVSGVHVYSDQFKTAALGNIVTSMAHRGRGLAALVTSRLVSELVEEKMLVTLNVKADNTPAIRCYQKLGFEMTHEYEEGLFELAR